MSVLCLLTGAGPALAAGAAEGPPSVAGVPVDFILFGTTLLGVALFHARVFYIALGGLAVITAYKLAFTGFKQGPGIAGLMGHLGHEWVTVLNLFCLLMGFALLSRHFEKSEVPVVLPQGAWPRDAATAARCGRPGPAWLLQRGPALAG
ncbi:MAG TPA: hypothetical protein VF104_01920 [Burkholderiales bacterium]